MARIFVARNEYEQNELYTGYSPNRGPYIYIYIHFDRMLGRVLVLTNILRSCKFHSTYMQGLVLCTEPRLRVAEQWKL